MKMALPLVWTLCILLAGCATPAADMLQRAAAPPANAPMIYVRAGCPYCESALDLLYGEGFRPVVRDVSRDRDAYRDLQAIYRSEFPDERVIVPVISYRGRYLRGFQRQALLDFLAGSPSMVNEELDYCEDFPAESATGTSGTLR